MPYGPTTASYTPTRRPSHYRQGERGVHRSAEASFRTMPRGPRTQAGSTVRRSTLGTRHGRSPSSAMNVRGMLRAEALGDSHSIQTWYSLKSRSGKRRLPPGLRQKLLSADCLGVRRIHSIDGGFQVRPELRVGRRFLRARQDLSSALCQTDSSGFRSSSRSAISHLGRSCPAGPQGARWVPPRDAQPGCRGSQPRSEASGLPPSVPHRSK